MTTRASNAPLQPGQTSIERARAQRLTNGKYRLRWRICLPDGRVEDLSTRADSVAAVKAKARLKAKDLLSTSASGQWSHSSAMTDYIETVTKPIIEAIDVDNTRKRYLPAMRRLVEAFSGQDIGNATKFRRLEAGLQLIAQSYGTASAESARSVLNKYVLGQMIRDDLIEANPIRGQDIDLTTHKDTPKAETRPLTADELNAAIDWLLALDPTEVEKPRRGRWNMAVAIEKKRCSIDLALLQAASGLRVSEANALTWDVFDRSAQITADHSKTKRGRTVPLLFEDVVTHLHQRKARGGQYVIGSPSDPNKPWDRDACRKAAADFYPELGRAIGAEDVFDDQRTHLWRSTLNSLMLDIPVEVRAAYFGHDKTTNQKYYTDTTDVTPVVEAARRLR